MNRRPTGWLPAFKLVRGVLTPEECQAVIDASHELAYAAVRINDDGTTRVDTSFRKCHTAHLRPGMPVYDTATAKLLARLDEINAHYEFEIFPEPERMIPTINVNRYDSSNYGGIGEHTDVGGFEDSENCKLALSIVLNTNFEGGDLNIYNGYRYKPATEAEVGDVVVFPTFYVHSVQAVTKGSRYSGVVWLRGPRFR